MNRALHNIRVPLVALMLSASGTALAAGRDNFDASRVAPRVTIATRVSTAEPASITAVDARSGAPSFLWAAGKRTQATFPTVEVAARAFVAGQAARYGLSREALDAARVVRVHDTGRGAVVVVLRQAIDGVEVFRSDAKVLLRRDGTPLALSGALHPGAVARPKGRSFHLSERDAIARAVSDLYEAALAPSHVRALEQEKGGYRYFDLSPGSALGAAGIELTRPVRAKKVFFPLPDRLVPAYYLELFGADKGKTSSDAYAYVIAADDGRLLFRQNLTHEDAFSYRVWADSAGEGRPWAGPTADYLPHPTGLPDTSYPPFVPATLVSTEGFNENPSAGADPWLPAGATESRGNNSDAYVDDDSPDGFSSGDLRAPVTSPGVFDWTYDPNGGPQASDQQKMASIVSAFYITNWQHDWWYDSGFDEAAGNAQKNNYGRGGDDGDEMQVQAQDGAPGNRNNANMSVPGDGASPRMQMFVWDGPSTSLLSVQPLAQNLPTSNAEFGPQSYDVASSVVLVNDGDSTATDACASIVNSVAGQIALVDRGNCTFKQKAVNVQAAGAVGMLLANHTANEPPPYMPDADPPGGITIPSMSITKADGDTLKASLGAGAVSASMHRVSYADRDGALDGGTVAHEWGHFLHLRLVPCGAPICNAQSEGWSDFNALLMLVREDDDLSGAFPLSQYATAGFPDDPAYYGIRRYPYSVDTTKNPLTFRNIQADEPLPETAPVALFNSFVPNNESHAAGEVWASMLFEAYVSMLSRTKGEGAAYSFAEAQRRMSDYVVAAMTLAPPDPTFLEQRDALLAAALAADKDDFLLLAEGFAKRGAGTCAVAPAKDSWDFIGVVEGYDVRPNASIVDAVLDDTLASCDSDGILDGAERGNLTVHVTNAGTGVLRGAKASIASAAADVEFPGGTTRDLPDIEPFQTVELVFEVDLGASVPTKEKLEIEVKVDSPSGCTESAVLVKAPRVNLDEVAAISATDDVETAATSWDRKGSEAEDIWRVIETSPGEHAWHGIDYGSPSDTALVSPELEVAADEPLVVSFNHRHQFEASDGIYWDGGVIEVTTDDGGSWTDVSELVDPGYGGTIGDPENQAKNVLRNRPGFVDMNSSWPERDPVTLDFGTSLAGQKIKLRFRIGTDDAAGAVGWELDDLAFQGIVNRPFAAQVANARPCEAVEDADGETVPGANGPYVPPFERREGCACGVVTGGGGALPGLAAAAVLALAGLLRRRRR